MMGLRRAVDTGGEVPETLLQHPRGKGGWSEGDALPAYETGFAPSWIVTQETAARDYPDDGGSKS